MSRSHDHEEDYSTLEQATAGLSDDLQPGRDLWPEISARISAPERPLVAALRWWQSPVVVAASLMVAASALTFALTRPGITEQPVLASQPAPAHVLDAGFLANRKRLENQLDGRISELSPEMQALVRENLASIRGSLNQISMALTTDPNNADLQDLLLGAYNQELQVMTELAKMPETNTRRLDL